MREALEAYSKDEWGEMRRPQGDSDHPTFRNASDEVLQVVRKKLRPNLFALCRLGDYG